jgi:hypothetical protein
VGLCYRVIIREKRKDNVRGVEKNQFVYVVFLVLSETCLVRFSSLFLMFFPGLIHHLLRMGSRWTLDTRCLKSFG